MTNEELQARRVRATHALNTLFLSAVGADVLSVLEAEFNCDRIKANDPHETYYRLGQHDALQTFKRLGDNNNG